MIKYNKIIKQNLSNLLVGSTFAIFLSILMGIITMNGCSNQETNNPQVNNPQVENTQAGNSTEELPGNDPVDEANTENKASNTSENTISIPQDLTEIPESYYSPAVQQGTLVELYYDTYESETYEEKSQVLNKRAIVYLPYGYNENEKYNVFYLMHGGWGNETTQLGTSNRPSSLKNVIDNGIANGDFEPLIIVCPTYNNTSPEDSANYGLAFYTLTVNYHNELVNDLIPAVEGTYSTYAESTSPEDIAASRDHRAFGGFSMGSVTTWYTFVNCLDQFRYFLPMSGAMDYQGDDVDAAVTASGHAPEDFFIFAMTGTIPEMKEYIDICVEGESSIPQRKLILEEKRKSLEEEMQRIQESLDYIDWKQNFYDDVLSGKIEYYSNLTSE